MAKQPLENVVQHLFQVAARAEFKTLTDQDLVKRYVERRDELAFGELVGRYRTMIWSICWRVLRHHQDMEDAFQATVMTLVRKAKTILGHEAIEGWLHRTAFTIASNAKVERLRRRAREERSATMRKGDYESHDSRWEWSEVLDKELIRIPEQYRSPLLLCYLQGLTQKEAAQRLGISIDTLNGRLRRGRERLKEQLRRYDIELDSAVLLPALVPGVHIPSVPPGLVEKTLNMARILMQSNGMLETAGIPAGVATLVKGAMGMTLRMKVLLGSMLLSLVVIGAGAARYSGILHLPLGIPRPEGSLEVMIESSAEPKMEKASPHVDRYGDPLPAGALARLGTVRFRHEKEAGRSLVLIPAKETTIIANIVGEAYRSSRDPSFWELSTGKPLSQLKDAQGQVIPVKEGLLMSLDGRLLASVRNPEAELKDREFCFWDMATGQLLSKRSEIGLSCLALSPDSKSVAEVIVHQAKAGGMEYKLHVWDKVAGKELWRKTCGRRPKDAKQGDFRIDPPVQLMYSPDGKTVLALYLGRMDNGKVIEGWEGIAQRWETATGKELPSVSIGITQADSWVWSSDGSMLAIVPHSSGNSKTPAIHLWNVVTSEEVRQIPLDKDIRPTVALSPDGKVLAANHDEGKQVKISLWDTATGKLLRCCDSHNCPAESMVFSHDGSMLVARCGQTTIHVWDVGTGKEVNRVWLERGHYSAASSVAFSSQGTTLISKNDDEVFLWDVDPVAETYSFQRLKDPIKLQMEKGRGLSWTRAVSSDGKIAASFGIMRSEDEKSFKSSVKVWEVATGQELKTFHLPEVPIDQSGSLVFRVLAHVMKLTPNGKVLAHYYWPAKEKAQIFFWDITTGKQICSPTFASKVSNRSNIKLEFSPDGKTLSTLEFIRSDKDTTRSDKDTTFAFHSFEVATGKLLASPKQDFISDVDRDIASHTNTWALSPDGRILVTSSRVYVAKEDTEAFRIHVWRVHADKHGVRLEHARRLTEETLDFLAFSPDSKLLVTRTPTRRANDGTLKGGVIQVWEITTGKERCRFYPGIGGTSAPTGFADKDVTCSFSSDGRRLATAHRDTTILLWDVTGRQAHGRLRPVQLSAQAREALWKDLSSIDAILANQALWSFVAAGDATVSFLKTQLRPALPKKKTPVETIARLIADLEHNSFAVRKKARNELLRLGEEAESSLRQALKKKPPLEVRRAIKEILVPLRSRRVVVVPPPPEEMRSLRAIEVLEHIGTREACQLLETLSRGDPEARQTGEAQASLCWLRQRGQP